MSAIEVLAAARRDRWRWLLAPALALLVVFFLYPLLDVLSLSVTEPEVGVGNFREFAESPVFGRVLWTTLRLSALVTLSSGTRSAVPSRASRIRSSVGPRRRTRTVGGSGSPWSAQSRSPTWARTGMVKTSTPLVGSVRTTAQSTNDNPSAASLSCQLRWTMRGTKGGSARWVGREGGCGAATARYSPSRRMI